MTDEEAAIANEQLVRDYQLTFGSPAGQRVLIDLALFCRAAETCVVAEKGQPVDINRTMILEGRREVFLRAQNYMKLTPDDLMTLRRGRVLKLGEQDND